VNYSQYDAGAIVDCTIVSSPGYQLKNITTTGGVSLVAINGDVARFVVNGPGTATGNYISTFVDYISYYVIIAIVAVAAVGVGTYLVRKRK
jgi:hypothetical protein